MTRSRRSQWRHAVAYVAVGIALGAYLVAEGHILLGIVVALAGVLLGRLVPMAPDESVSHWEAQQRHVRDNSVIIYWRPGCVFCMRLRLALGARVHRASMVNIWADDAAAAFVRDVNGGAETVPTVILRNGDAVTNPPPAKVLAELDA